MRTLIVGDVHGCRAELDTLLARFAPQPGDRVVLVGDIVSKGPDSQGVVRRARTEGFLAVRGNHDEVCLKWRRACVAGDEPPRLGRKHLDACEALSDEDWAWLEARPYYLRLPDVNAVVVHAGLVPDVPLEDQDPNDLINMRSIRPDGSPSARIEEGVPWASRWPGPEEVVFGHDAVRGLQRFAHATGLDTGCVYGGHLTGYVLPERTFLSVPAERAWSPAGGGNK